MMVMLKNYLLWYELLKKRQKLTLQFIFFLKEFELTLIFGIQTPGFYKLVTLFHTFNCFWAWNIKLLLSKPEEP